MNRFRVFVVLSVSLIVTPAVKAIEYTYTGNAFNNFSTPSSFDPSMAVTGTIELAEPLASNLSSATVTPVSFSFNDGVSTISDTGTDLTTLFEFSTDAFGVITEWQIVILDAPSPLPPKIGEITLRIETTNLVAVGSKDQGSILTCTEIIVTPTGTSCEFASDLGAIKFQPGTWSVGPVIDDSADVADDASIGDGSTVGENAEINTGVVIGNNSTINANVIINKDAELGDTAVIGQGSVVNKDVSAGSNLTVGTNVIINKNVIIGDGVTIGDNTTIGQGTVIGNDVQIGLIGGGVGVVIGKNVIIGDGQVIGDGENILAGTTIP